MGGTTATAKLLGVSKSTVAQFKTGKRRLPVLRALEVEKLVGGLVTHQQMRPDLPWITAGISPAINGGESKSN